MRELFLLPDAKRRLFAGIDKHVTEAGAVRRKLVELHEELLGVNVTTHSPDVEAAYRLFVGELERRRESQQDNWDRFQWWRGCGDWTSDHLFFEGILDDYLTEYQHEDGAVDYQFDWPRVDRYLESIDFSDPQGAAQAWVVVLAYLLMDYRYLYL